MKKIFFLILTLFTLSGHTDDIVTRDPYFTQFSGPGTYLLKVRILNHGVRDADLWIKEQIRAAEMIFAQCGEKVSIEITKIQNLPLSTAQDHLLELTKDGQVFTDEAITFFNQVVMEKKDDIMDIHVVDHLNPEIRLLQTTINQTLELGVSFNPNLFDWTYFGASSKLAGHSLFVAAETVRLESNNFIRIDNRLGHARNLSLLAHELGHQILESQTQRQAIYHDHWCSELNDECPSKNLMNAGGNSDYIWKERMTNKIVGYDPLPLVNHAQCKTLYTHPLIKKLNP